MACSNPLCSDMREAIHSPLQEMQRTISNIQITSYAYGLFDTKRQPESRSNESVHSAYEVTEDQDIVQNATEEADSEYYSAFSSMSPLHEFRSAFSLSSIDSSPPRTVDSVSPSSSSSDLSSSSSTSGNYSIPTESEERLPDILKDVKTSIDKLSKSLEDVQKTPKIKLAPLKTCQSTPIKLPSMSRYAKEECYPKSMTDQIEVHFSAKEHTSSDDEKIAQVVHDLVLKRYEESYKRLLQKLKKLKLSNEENKFRNVIAELESMFVKKNELHDKNSDANSQLESSKILKNVAKAKIYSSTDSGLESDAKVVGSSFGEALPKNSIYRGYTNKTLNGIKQDFYREFVAEVPLDKMTGSDIWQVYASTIQVDHKNAEKMSYNPLQENPTSSLTEFPINDQHLRRGNLQRSETEKYKDSEYDEHEFLETALGEELLLAESSEEYLFSPTASIDTNDVSELLSSRSTLSAFRRRKRKNRKSINTIISNFYHYEKSPVNNDTTEILQQSGDPSTTPDLINEPFRYSYASYEDVTNLGLEIYSDEGKKQIKKHIFINENIIEQTEKMLRYGLRKTANFVGSHVHLEGERILLVSKMRRQVLINYLYRVPETTGEAVARVTIENVRCILNSTEDSQNVGQQYYICILQHKTTVYSTRIAAPNKLGWVDLGGFFIFDNVSNNFNIKIQLYSVKIPAQTSMCLTLPFLKCSPKLPMMELAGEAYIGMLNINNTKFTFKNGDNIKSKEHKLTASIEATMMWPQTLKSFLTIGTGKMDQQPVWNRRWCILEDSKLKYYNYPSDENFCPPLGIINLQVCKAFDEADTRYLDQRTLRLFLQHDNSFKRILIVPDTNEDCELWSKHIEIILKLVKEWNINNTSAT